MIRAFVLMIRELAAIKLLELAMWVAPNKMSGAIATGIWLTFRDPSKVLEDK